MGRFACPTRLHFTVVAITHQYVSTTSALSACVHKHPYAIVRVELQPVVEERAVAMGLSQVETQFVLEFRVIQQLAPRETAYAVRHFACECSTLLHCQELLRWRVCVESREGFRVLLR